MIRIFFIIWALPCGSGCYGLRFAAVFCRKGKRTKPSASLTRLYVNLNTNSFANLLKSIPSKLPELIINKTDLFTEEDWELAEGFKKSGYGEYLRMVAG